MIKSFYISVIPFTVPFGTEPIKLLPAISSLNMAYNPLKSEHQKEMKLDYKTRRRREKTLMGGK